MSTISICEGAEWDVVEGDARRLIMPADAHEFLDEDLINRMRSANPANLLGRFDLVNPLATTLSSTIYAIAGAPEHVAKLSKTTEQDLAVNVGLEHGFKAMSSNYRTPHYLGLITMHSGASISIMSRVPGIRLSNVDGWPESDATEGEDDSFDARPIVNAGYAALASVGVLPDAVAWDLTDTNLMVPADAIAETALDGPVWILDQLAAPTRL
jgi:hypothetical protein